MIDDLAEQHERLGKAVTRLVAEHAATLESRRVTSEATPADLEKLFTDSLIRRRCPLPFGLMPCHQCSIKMREHGAMDQHPQ